MNPLTLFSKRLSILLLALCIAGVSPGPSSRAFHQEQSAALAETIVDSDITTDTTWTLANSPYLVTSDIYVEPGVTLTIEPGVTVWLERNQKIHVGREGIGGASIIAKGTPDQPIAFDRYRDPDTGLAPRWKKIHIHPNSDTYFRYVDFSYGGASSDESAILHIEGPGTHVFNMCTIRDSKLQGITAQGDSLSVVVAGTLFKDNGRRSVMADSGANVTVTGSTFDVEERIAVYLRDKGAPAAITVNDSNILAEEIAVFNEMAGSASINAQQNWWGQASGPSASAVNAGVDYSNWRTAEVDPLIGITTPPTAAFTVAPDPTIPQSPATVYTFDASGSTDAEDYTSSLEVCWDWDNDGTCETDYSTTKTTTHVFGSGGVQTVRLVVRDTDGDTDEATQDVHTGNLPVPAFTFTQTTWSQVIFDASASSDVETSVSQLQAGWDWEGDGDWDVTGVGVTEIQTHTYSHLGRYWPTLYVEDTDNLTDTLRKPVDIIPPAKALSITNSGGTLDSTDHTVQVAVYTDTVASGVISNGLVITHTPWLTLPHGSLESAFTYQGFNLSAQSLTDGQSIDEISGTYTITISYDYDYFVNVLRLPPFEGQLVLYRWVTDTDACWMSVTSILEMADDRLVATTGSFGDFVLAMDVYSAYLPVVIRTD